MHQAIRKLAFVLPVTLALVTTVPAAPGADAPAVAGFEPSRAHQQATRLITRVMEDYHLQHRTLDDSLSVAVFRRYVETMDPAKRYLLATDIAEFERHIAQVDDFLRDAELQPMFELFARFRERVLTRSNLARQLAGQNFDFSVDESYDVGGSAEAWRANDAELDELWRRHVKNDALLLRLAGKDDAAVREILAARYAAAGKQAQEMGADFAFETLINAYLTAIDADTRYLGASSLASVTPGDLSLVGVGLALRAEQGQIFVDNVVANGPADREGGIGIGDTLLAVGDGPAGEIKDVVGMRLDDVVNLIRGRRNTFVRLQILPSHAGANATPEIVMIERDRVEPEAPPALVTVIPDPAVPAAKIGLLRIATFYVDFEAMDAGREDYRSTSRDVAQILRDLTGQGLSGLVIDLRGNRGGSLAEAVALAGLFIDRGPVLQVKDSQGKDTIERDDEAGMLYDGPLALLVDAGTAGASEIFAAAIQDYRRGLIVGQGTSAHGKVQNMIDLNRFDPGKSGQLGHLRLTIAEFFRIDGSSFAGRGVIPDVALPLPGPTAADASAVRAGELSPSRIATTAYTPLALDAGRLAQAGAAHAARMTASSAGTSALQLATKLREMRERSVVPLAEPARRTLYEEDMKTLKAWKSSQEASRLRGTDEWQEETARVLLDYTGAATAR